MAKRCKHRIGWVGFCFHYFALKLSALLLSIKMVLFKHDKYKTQAWTKNGPKRKRQMRSNSNFAFFNSNIPCLNGIVSITSLSLSLSLYIYIYIYVLRIELTTKILKKFIALIEEGNKSIKLNTSIEKSNYTTTFFFLSKCGGLNLQVIGLYTARVPTCLHEVVVITLLAIKNTNCKTFTTHKRGAIQLNPSLSIIYLYIKVILV